ncbi:MAG: hypothetical protein J1F69_05555 [Clostridiales bacterium]|nr:hypothetical protein [Clostridiales bacterium]
MTILILGIVAGFTNTFETDNRRFAASWGETIVMEAEPPTHGTPSDYDLLSNLKYTAYKIHHSRYFRGDTDGKVMADIGIGSYTQYLTNTRVVYNQNTVFTETISSSKLKSLAEQKYADNGIIIYRPADKIDGKKTKFSSKAMQMSYGEYSKKYGAVPNQLSKYIINEKTIISVKDENAGKAQSLNGDDDGDVKFDVPERLVPNADGNYVFTLTLKPLESTLYYRNEVRTLGGADQNPKFYSVKITITVNSEWIPLSTRAVEEYDIEIPVLGAMRCVGENVERFTMFNDENGTIPEKDFFQPYVDKAKENPDYTPPDVDVNQPLSASDYLAAAFEKYLSGESNLDLKANIVMGGFSAYDLTLSVNLDTLNIQAMLGRGLYVKYDGDKIYLKNNKINGYIPIADVKKLTADPMLSGLLGGLGSFDINKIFGGDILDVVFENCEMNTEDDITEITLSFALDLSDIIPSLDNVQVDAAILINDGDKSLNGITGEVTIGDTVIKLDVAPLATLPAFPSVSGAVNLSDMLDFVPDIVSTAMQTTYGIDGTVTIDGLTATLSAYVDRTNGLAAEAVINVLGIDVTVKYVNEVIYIDACGVAVRGTIEELPTLLDAALDLIDFGKYQSMLKLIMPTSVNQIVQMLDSLTVDKSSLEVGLKFINNPINIKLTRGNGKLQSLAFSADIDMDMFGIKADLAAELNISEPSKRNVVAPTGKDFLTFTDLAALINDVKPYLDARYFTAAIDGYVQAKGTRGEIGGSFGIDLITDKDNNITGTAAAGGLSALGQQVNVTYIDNAVYVSIGNIKAKLDTSDTNSLIASALLLVDLVAGMPELPEIDIAGLASDVIKSIKVTDGTLNIALSAAGYDINISLNLKTGKISIAAFGDGISAQLNITVTTDKSGHNITAPADKDKYVNVAELSALFEAAAKIIDAGAITMPVTVSYGDKKFTALVEAQFAGSLAVRITENTLGLSIILFGDTAYVSLGEIRLSGTLADAKQLFAEISDRYALPPVDQLLQMLPQDIDIQSVLALALGAINSISSENGVLCADIAVNGFGANVALKSDLSEITVTTAVKGKTIGLTCGIACGSERITAPDGNYIGISEFTAMLPVLFTLADSTKFEVVFGANGGGYSVGGSAIVDIENGVNASASINALGQNIELYYIDGVIYFGIQAIRVKVSPDQVQDLIPSAKKLLGALGITLPDVGKTVDVIKNSVTIDSVISGITTGISAIKSFTAADGVITVVIEYAGQSATLTVDTTTGGVSLTVAADILGNDIGVNIALCATEKQVTLPDTQQYSDILKLGPIIDAATDILTAGGVSAVVNVAVGDLTLSASIQATIQDGALKVLVKEDTLGLTVTLLGDTAYIDVGGIKVSGQLKDITDLIDAVIPNLPEIIRPYVAEMNRQMMGVIPSQDEMTTNGKTDIAKTLDTVLAMISRFTVNDDMLIIGVTRNALSATLRIAIDLSAVSGEIALTFDGIGGPFGNHYEMAFGIDVQNISAATVVVPQVDAAAYVPASNFLAVLNSILPLAKENAFDIGISVTLFEQTIAGNIYVDLGDYTPETIAVRVGLNVAGAPVTVSIIQSTLYLDINNGSVRLMLPLTKDGLTELIAQIDEALPELELSDKLQALLDSIPTDIVISDLLNNITLAPTEDGMELSAAFNNVSIVAKIALVNGVLGAIEVSGNIADTELQIGLDVFTTEDGVLSGIQSTSLSVDDIQLGLSLTISPVSEDDRRAVTVDGTYMTISDILPYVSPVKSLIEKATKAKTITLDLSNMAIEVMSKLITVSGRIVIALDPVKVSAELTLFADSDDAVKLYVVYVDDVVYVSVGMIELKFDIATDMQVLNEAIEPYMPKSLKSLGDLGALSPIFAIISSIGKIVEAPDVTAIMDVLFNADNAYGKSLVQQILDNIMLFKRSSGNIAVGVTVMDTPMTITLNVEPVIDNGYLDFKFDTKISNLLSIAFTAKLTFSEEEYNITAPTDGNYAPIVDFVTTVINAVNTLTAKAPDKVTKNADGSVTTVSQTAFEIAAFTFDYDMFKVKTTINENGETVEVLDEAGRPAIETDSNGNKIKEKIARVSNISGQKALRFGLTTTTVKDAKGKQISKTTKVMIEAHLKIDLIESDGKTHQTGFPIEIDLYVTPTEDRPDGLAYIYYREANGYGEKISIDYTSIMQIVAAVLDILGADDDTIDTLLKDYRLDIDSSVFDYMSISGLDEISDMIDNLVKALEEAKQALSYGKSAWNRLQNAEDLDALIREMTSETADDGNATIKSCLDSMIDHIKAAIALFGTEDEEDTEEDEQSAVNGALVGKVVNSVYFTSENSVLSAHVNNAVATGTEGWAAVSVTSANNTINDIGVTNLDVNKAKLNKFDMQFAPITEVIEITIPTDYKTEVDPGNNKVRYADLANIKHLIFDVMNTANLMEFEIGSGSNDKINVKMNIPLLVKLDINIGYNAKVKIIDTGETDSDGDPIVKTAVAIDIYNSKAEAQALSGLAKEVIIPECTTSLYFYDDVIYIQGVKSWDTQSIQVGMVTQVNTPQKRDKITSNNWYNSGTPTTSTKTYSVNTSSSHRLEYINVAYTVDELLYMMGNDINTFLDEFLYYLIPITNEKVLRLVNIRDTIRDAINGSGDSGTNTQNTLAQIFKSYTYNNGAHNIVIGLAELAGSSALSDLSVTLVGKNDGDDETTGNMLNNYISTLSITTKIASLIDVSLNASLNNVVEGSDGKISSRGLTNVGSNFLYNSFALNNNTYGTPRNYLPDVVVTLDGSNIYAPVANGELYKSLPRLVPVAVTSSYDEQAPEDRISSTETSGGGVLSKDRTIIDKYIWLTNGYKLFYDYYVGYENGVPYIYRQDGNTVIRVATMSLSDAILADVVKDAHGKIQDVRNRAGGVQWTRPWKEAYEASQAK